MHLLAAQAGAIQQEGEAIDLGQSPGDIVFASAADSELAVLAAATDRSGYDGLRLANLLRLGHNLSVDLWLENTVRHARLVVVRLLGGPAYWPYGVDELFALARSGAVRLALFPGDASPDPILRDRSTIAPEAWDRLFALLVAGGAENGDTALAAMREMAGGGGAATGPSPLSLSLPRFGLWPTSDPLRGGGGSQPIVPILFYRALLEGAGTAVLEALAGALAAKGLAPLPIFVASLKEPEAVAFLQKTFAAAPPAVILNLTGFALGLDGLPAAQNPFAGIDAPVLQLIQGGRPEGLRAADSQGLSPKDLAMQVVLPELDGRHGFILVGHKAESLWHARTQCPLTAFAPDADGIARAAGLAENWVRLRQAPRAERRVAIVLANYPIRDGRLANGVGYDAPQSTVEILRLLDQAGYVLAPEAKAPLTPSPRGRVRHGVSGTVAPHSLPCSFPLAGEDGWGVNDAVPVLPTSSADLIAQLQAGPTNAHPGRAGGIAFPLARYGALFAALPAKIQAEVTVRWGAPETDPFVRDGSFHLPALRFGNVAILLQPARGYDRDAAANYHDPDLVPPHAYLAAYLWLRHEFAAHALLHNGKHGSLEWLPGKAVALDAASYPAALWDGLPQFYPFIVNDPGEGTQAKRRTGAVIIDHLVPPLTRAETYGPLKDLEALLDEYYAAAGLDRRRLAELRRRILAFARDARLDHDVALPADETEALKRLDNFLCELKEAQIRDGLHVFGQSPAGALERDLIVALARVPRGGDHGGDASLIRALADDLKLGIDPLTAKLGDDWTGPTFAAWPTPSPPLPTRGRVFAGVSGEAGDSTRSPTGTLPLVGRAGEGRAAPETPSVPSATSWRALKPSLRRWWKMQRPVRRNGWPHVPCSIPSRP